MGGRHRGKVMGVFKERLWEWINKQPPQTPFNFVLRCASFASGAYNCGAGQAIEEANEFGIQMNFILGKHQNFEDGYNEFVDFWDRYMKEYLDPVREKLEAQRKAQDEKRKAEGGPIIKLASAAFGTPIETITVEAPRHITLDMFSQKDPA